ncbi:AIPR family protein [Campylobacter concisus]|uniref:AIPR family protein n=1 Tax=Campylobacter concisus TaxID=199 RepID=UPI000CD93DCD|nr:AIPR family protein [Campylobacter concisus]
MAAGFHHYSLPYNIYPYLPQNETTTLRLIIITDGKITNNLASIPTTVLSGIDAEYRIIDIEFLYKIYTINNSKNNFDVEVDLPALVVDTPAKDYRSYLSVIDGRTIVEIYDTFGSRLLEQNVRTFLQFRGNVNKGLRNTIEYKPEMFFAYNNGITATANDVILQDGKIIKISNFQIVNGGQTVSAIYASSKNSKLDVSKIYVQMKLSVVADTEKQDEFVSKVSEYANTQNKINQSDFFSNSPFHKDFKECSRRNLAPAVDGIQVRTHWFYERVRGEYLNEQAYLSGTDKKKFQIENPKSQLIDKTFLAKSEIAWLQSPDIVSKGAQYSFMAFAKHITQMLEKDELCITSNYFKEAVSRIIMFKQVEKLVSYATWYNGGYRAQCVAYTLSYLSYYLEKNRLFLNFSKIWDEQKISNNLENIISIVASKIYTNITNPPEGNANIGQWCKKKLCWDSIKDIEISLEFDDEILSSAEEEKYIKKEARKDKKLDDNIEVQSFVVKFKDWDKILKYYEKDEIRHQISMKQMDILAKIANGSIGLPSIKQAIILYDLYENAIKEGFLI